MAIAFAGLALIGLTIGSDLKVAALGLALAGALSWAVGNVLVKRAADIPTFPLVVWSSLIPPLPALIVSSVSDQRSLPAALFFASCVPASLFFGALPAPREAGSRARVGWACGD